MSPALLILLVPLAGGAATGQSPASVQRRQIEAAPRRALAQDRCVAGYVWREAFPDDHVCVTPEVRAQAAEDNRLAARRRQPGGGAYGPDTCRAGFVWREAGPDDRVCVTAETRAQTARDNRAATGRVAAPGGLVRPGREVRPGAGILRPDIQVTPPSIPGPPPPSEGRRVRRGFDEDGQPYIEETLADGSIRREQDRGVTVIAPDGTRRFYPRMVVRANAPIPTPPELPLDPARGRGWVVYHNDQLLALIRTLVDDDPSEMQKFAASEQLAVGDDLFKQVEYRIRVLQTLARP